MVTTASMPRPPITQLRPLHCYQQLSQHESGSLSPAQASQDNCQLLHWDSTLDLTLDENTCIKAFVKLVSNVLVLDLGETFCIQHTAGGGFIFARHGDEDGGFTFVDYNDSQDALTDFAIGPGSAKVSPLGRTQLAGGPEIMWWGS